MPRYETRSSQFGLVSGIRQPRSDMVLVAEPAGLFAPEARKGRLYIIAETDQDLSRGRDACQLVCRTINKIFYDDRSYSVTSALRRAISAANKALYQQNFNVMAQKRAVVGVSCAVIKGNDLYIAQVAPTQAYMLAEGKLRAIPTNLSWNPAQAVPASFVKLGAVGASLSIEPEFYRAVLRPGDAVLLCTSNLARLLGRDDVMRLLRSPEPDQVIEGVLAICKQNALPEAHGIAVTLDAPLSPAAQAAPLSRAGIAERGWLALHNVGDWVARMTGEATLLVRGPGARTPAQRAESRQERNRREQEQLAELPAEPPYSPHPIEPPRPLDLGDTLDTRRSESRHSTEARAHTQRAPDQPLFPPSAFLGEGEYTPPSSTERRIDLSDTPSMAALGRRAHPSDGTAFLGDRPATLGERLRHPFASLTGAISNASYRRHRRRPPQSAMPRIRSQQGLSYRRQRISFPWVRFLLLIALVALAIMYGVNVSREAALQQADDALGRAEQSVADIRAAPNEIVAQERLDVAAVAIADLSTTSLITTTQENRLRYTTLLREYERALAAVQKLTYFEDLTVIAQHPVQSSFFSSVVAPPLPQNITDTVAFDAIYVLDANIGMLYRLPKDGGALEPFLRPDDAISGLPVGKVWTQAWRFDNVIAVAQSSNNGPFIYYFRSGGAWKFSNLAGSEEWGRVADRHFRVITYDGNLYVWGAIPGNVLKYKSGQFGDLPTPWIRDDGGHNLDNVRDMAVDGKIYLLQPDGRILVFDAGAFEREIAPVDIKPPLVTATSFFLTGTAENGAIFLVDVSNERIVQIDRQTGALIQQIRARPNGPLRLDQLIGVAVDQGVGRPVLYLINGGQILRASLPNPPRPFRETDAATPTSATPAPTIAP